MVPRDDRPILELELPGLAIFNPGSLIPEGFRISFAAPEADNTTAGFEIEGKEVVGNLTGFVENARGIRFGNFSIVNDVLEDIFGEWITIDESAPETVKSTLSAVSDAVDDGQITYEELESISDRVRGQKEED
ncbi:hypothetical protein Slin15195_G080900 [Septoria linicola]|uniref:Uncharacterized protein n=1 Tax=Septoria linicola TaxID=215465 RepID=A0A9Q9AZW1_9PEZI|nr:hypothetical protein Slin15195_G080900 [Septoria linicola]